VAAGSLAGGAHDASGLRGVRVAYAASVAVLIVLALATLGSPLILPLLRRERAALPDVGKVQVIAKPGEWVLQYNLLNSGAEAAAYTFELATSPAASAGGDSSRVLHTSSVFVDAGRAYVFIYHLRPEQVQSDAVRFALSRSGSPAPVEDLTLHLTSTGGER
jgi:hypothetical protein